MPLSRKSSWVAAGVVTLTLLGSATSAFADRNMYTHSRTGYAHHERYQRHMRSPFHRHMMSPFERRMMMMRHHRHHHMM